MWAAKLSALQITAGLIATLQGAANVVPAFFVPLDVPNTSAVSCVLGPSVLQGALIKSAGTNAAGYHAQKDARLITNVAPNAQVKVALPRARGMIAVENARVLAVRPSAAGNTVARVVLGPAAVPDAAGNIVSLARSANSHIWNPADALPPLAIV